MGLNPSHLLFSIKSCFQSIWIVLWDPPNAVQMKTAVAQAHMTDTWYSSEQISRSLISL